MEAWDWSLVGKIVWVIFIIAWGVIRWRPNIRARRHPVKRSHRSMKDRVLLVISFCGLGFIPGLWVFSGFPDRFDMKADPAGIVAGAIVLLLCLWLFRLTHKALGLMWSNTLELRKGHKLVTTSVYERVRHPMYSAFWLWAVAQPLVLANWVAGFSGIVGFGILYFLRVGDEEKVMEKEFGEEYEKYKRTTKKIIPGIY